MFWVWKMEGGPPKNSVPPPKAWFRCGYVTKQGIKVKNWKKRWFVLTDEHVHYFESEDCTKHCGSIVLSSFLDLTTNPKKPNILEYKTETRIWYFSFTDRKEKEDWQTSLNWFGSLCHRVKQLQGKTPLTPIEEVLMKCKEILGESMLLLQEIQEYISKKNSSAVGMFEEFTKLVNSLLESAVRVDKNQEDNKSYVKQLGLNAGSLSMLIGDRIIGSSSILDLPVLNRIKDTGKNILVHLEFISNFASKNQ